MDTEIVVKMLSQASFEFPVPVRKISVPISVYNYYHKRPGLANTNYNNITDEEIAERQQDAMSSLDGLASLPGKGVDLLVLANGYDTNWLADMSRSLLTEDAFKELLDQVFPRLVALREAGYKVSLIVDAESREHSGLGRIFNKQDFEYVFMPENAELSPEGYMNKMREVSADIYLEKCGRRLLIYIKYIHQHDEAKMTAPDLPPTE